MIYHYITGGRRNSYLIKYSDNIMINYAYMINIKKSVPYKTSDKSWYYQHCLQETLVYHKW